MGSKSDTAQQLKTKTGIYRLELSSERQIFYNDKEVTTTKTMTVGILRPASGLSYCYPMHSRPQIFALENEENDTDLNDVLVAEQPHTLEEDGLESQDLLEDDGFAEDIDLEVQGERHSKSIAINDDDLLMDIAESTIKDTEFLESTKESTAKEPTTMASSILPDSEYIMFEPDYYIEYFDKHFMYQTPIKKRYEIQEKVGVLIITEYFDQSPREFEFYRIDAKEVKLSLDIDERLNDNLVRYVTSFKARKGSKKGSLYLDYFLTTEQMSTQREVLKLSFTLKEALTEAEVESVLPKPLPFLPDTRNYFELLKKRRLYGGM